MAISQSSIAALPNYTDAELIKLYRWGLANNAAGQTRSVNGDTVSFPSVKDMLLVLDRLGASVSVDGTIETGGDNVLVQYGERI